MPRARIGTRSEALAILPKVCQYWPLAYYSRVITYNYLKQYLFAIRNNVSFQHTIYMYCLLLRNRKFEKMMLSNVKSHSSVHSQMFWILNECILFWQCLFKSSIKLQKKSSLPHNKDVFRGSFIVERFPSCNIYHPRWCHDRTDRVGTWYQGVGYSVTRCCRCCK